MKKNDLNGARIPAWMSSLISEEDRTALTRKRSSSFDAPSHNSFQTLDLPSMLQQLKTTERESKYKWCIDEERDVITSCFLKRKWNKVNTMEDDWNIYWAVHRKTAELLFKLPLKPLQFINHFPNYNQLTRKDHFALNWRKHNSTKGVPLTYLLPEEYNLFVNKFNENNNKLWIVKPADKARGIGIFLVDSLHKIPDNLKDSNSSCNEKVPSWSKGTFVISEYISNPWLINTKKFDLRIYVLVTQYSPTLNAYIYEHGFARFATEKYSIDSSSLDNTFIHLTNVATNQLNRSEAPVKWDLLKILKHLETIAGKETANKLHSNIKSLIQESLLACRNAVEQSDNSFEIYGYDVLVDDKYNPWLLEINGSPSMEPTDERDFKLKEKMIQDAFDIVMAKHDSPLNNKNGFEKIVVG